VKENREVIRISFQTNSTRVLRAMFLVVGLFCPVLSTLVAEETRLKDLITIRGVRTNQLIGYGLIVGLPGTGDSGKSLTTNRSVSSMLTRLGINSTPTEAIGRSAAAVIAIVELPTFARSGDKVDIRVSTIGDAKSLAGGTLLMTPLRAGDGQVYVVGQGAVIVGQATGSGTSVLTVANVPGGGMVEREFTPTLAVGGSLDINLKSPDFTTNSRIVDSINQKLKGFYAISVDPAAIKIEIPKRYLDRQVEFIAELEGLKIKVDRKAVVAINERTGTVVLGNDISIGPISIAHGDLSISIGDQKKKSKDKKSLVGVSGTTVGELVNSLNSIGVKPKDLIGILQAMHAAGALSAELRFL
jgi:flagellar P-ring protein precursor FlgI